MSKSVSRKLDLVSRVTIHVFAGEVLFAALLAASGSKAFAPTFAVLLTFLAVIQVMAALGACRRAPSSSLTEWDGVTWLLLVATGALLFAR
ncbi:hypothetical protein C5L14_21520 [Labrys okinawensis]|uniref:Uncharacterized protein n=1 Tax=Labrys okinawensis TaxID=346911 RepID=A0A2S9Q8F1_9HYPH|nr:hypothetical protein [Labrys okinawensis]PRH85564.1 hypothetical protein C5L14_21520 [Labrys okinawensis]